MPRKTHLNIASQLVLSVGVGTWYDHLERALGTVTWYGHLVRSFGAVRYTNMVWSPGPSMVRSPGTVTCYGHLVRAHRTSRIGEGVGLAGGARRQRGRCESGRSGCDCGCRRAGGSCGTGRRTRVLQNAQAVLGHRGAAEHVRSALCSIFLQPSCYHSFKLLPKFQISWIYRSNSLQPSRIIINTWSESIVHKFSP
jgi:hypothetical protein